MDNPDKMPDDTRVEQVMGNLLRTGVILAAVVAAVGGAVYLGERWHEPTPPYRGNFPLPEKDHPGELNSVPGAVRFAFTEPPGQGLGRGLIQLGALLLIATPVARVGFSAYAFARQRDWLYVVVTLVVLTLLLVSFLCGPWLPGA